jgi:hypothetical protein
MYHDDVCIWRFIMVRTQIYLTEKERDGLALLAEVSGKKQSELIRNAVDVLISQFSPGHRDTVLNKAAGLWQTRQDLPDFAHLRKQWDRS